MAQPGRPQSPELNLRPQLQPAPVVGVQMVRPQNLDGAGDNLIRIADALASFQGSLGRWGASQKTKAPEDTFAKRNAFRTPEDIVAQPDYDPRKEPHQVLVGQATANTIGPQMRQWVMEEWDQEAEPDLYKFLSGRLGELQQTMPEAAQAGFGSTIDSSVKETVNWWTGLQNDAKNQEIKQDTLAHFISLNEQFKELPVEQRVAKMKEMGLDQYRMLKFVDGKGSNDLLFNSIEHFARTGDKDMVRALADLRRGKSNEVASLYDTPEFTDRIDAAIATADTVWQRNNQTAIGDFEKQIDEIVKSGDENKLNEVMNGPVGVRLFPDPITRGTRLRTEAGKLKENILKNTVTQEQLALDEGFRGTVLNNFDKGEGGQNYDDPSVVTKDGKVYTFKGDTKAQEVLDVAIKERYAEAAGDPAKVAAIDNDLMRKAAQSPLKITEWENLFASVGTSTITNQIMEGKIPPNVTRAYELWKNTRDNPKLRRDHMGDNVSEVDDLFTAAEIFEKTGQPTQEAFVSASQAIKNKDGARGRIGEELMGPLGSGYGIRDYPFEVQETITERAILYLAAGAHGQKNAVAKAIKDFEDETIILEGFGTRPSYVTVPDKRINKEAYAEGITNFVTNQITLHGAKQEPPISIEDVNIKQLPGGRFMIEQDDGEPVPAMLTHRGGAKGRPTTYFTYEDIQKQLEADAKATEDQIKSDAVNQTSIFEPEGQKKVLKTVKDAVSGVFGGDEKAKPDPDKSILKGYTDVPERYYGAKTVSQLGELSDYQLRTLRKLAKEGFVDGDKVKRELPDIGFIDKSKVEKVWKDRVAGERRRAGYSKEQVSQAMSRWSLTDELEAIERLKKNNAPKEPK